MMRTQIGLSNADTVAVYATALLDGRYRIEIIDFLDLSERRC
jgi:hypothetical protein